MALILSTVAAPEPSAGYEEPALEEQPTLDDPFAQPAEPAAQPSEPAAAPAEPVAEPPPPAAEPALQPSDQPTSALYVPLMVRGVKETVMGSVFLGLGGVLLAVGIPTILQGVEERKVEETESRGSLKLAGGAAATGIGGLFSLFGIILLPIGVSNIVKAKRGYALRPAGSVAFGRTMQGTWTTGLKLSF